MIKSLFRQMWNQRHANVWVWVELVVVLVLLWYSIDLVYNYEAAARQTKGYDTENVFDIQLNIKPALQNDSVLMSHSAEYLEQIYHLIQQYQGVEEACFYYGTIPYTGNNMYEDFGGVQPELLLQVFRFALRPSADDERQHTRTSFRFSFSTQIFCLHCPPAHKKNWL